MAKRKAVDAQTKMLIKCLNKIKELENITLVQSYLKLLDYSAYTLGLDANVILCMKQDTRDYLNKTLDFELLKEQCWDWFGEAAHCSGIKEFKILPEQNAYDLLASEYHYIYSRKFPQPLTVREVHSGRKYLSFFNKYGDNLIYYGVAKEEMLYKTALVNFKLYNIPAFILNIDDIGDIDLNVNSENWRIANSWEKPRIKLLKKIGELE